MSHLLTIIVLTILVILGGLLVAIAKICHDLSCPKPVKLHYPKNPLPKRMPVSAQRSDYPIMQVFVQEHYYLGTPVSAQGPYYPEMPVSAYGPYYPGMPVSAYGSYYPGMPVSAYGPYYPGMFERESDHPTMAINTKTGDTCMLI